MNMTTICTNNNDNNNTEFFLTRRNMENQLQWREERALKSRQRNSRIWKQKSDRNNNKKSDLMLMRRATASV